jgi:hypothetical protein
MQYSEDIEQTMAIRRSQHGAITARCPNGIDPGEGKQHSEALQEAGRIATQAQVPKNSG